MSNGWYASTVDVRALHRDALDAFDLRVRHLAPGSWRHPTPCSEWDVRALVNHVVGENRWIPPLLAGSTVTEVGGALDGDLLGGDPFAVWQESTAAALEAVGSVAPDRIVHLSFGDVPAKEYLWQLTTDALIHSWDLARATGQPESLPEALVEACAGWFDTAEDAYRAAGAIGPAVSLDVGEPQDMLLARFGRNPSPADALAAVVRFNQAFAAHDLDILGENLTDDCRFVDTTSPDGVAYHGRHAVLGAFKKLFSTNPSASFETEGGLVCGDRVVLQWRYDWREGGGGHVRGVDLFTVRRGRVSDKQSYVKG